MNLEHADQRLRYCLSPVYKRADERMGGKDTSVTKRVRNLKWRPIFTGKKNPLHSGKKQGRAE